MIIEFMGPGGSGKTTLIRQVSSELSNLRPIVSDFSHFSWTGILSNPLRFLSEAIVVIRVYLFTGSKIEVRQFGRNQAKLTFYLISSRVMPALRKISHLLNPSPNTVFLMEHGHWTYRYDISKHLGKDAEFSVLPLDGLISLEFDEKTVVGRVAARGLSKGPESRSIVEDPNYAKNYFAHVRKWQSTAVNSTDQTLVLDSSRPIDQLASEAVAAILAWGAKNKTFPLQM